MKELQTIIGSYRHACSQRLKAALATVVHVSGSAYRRPGARMLILENGETVGSISGGCLERDVIEQAMQVMQTNNFVMMNFDTSHDDDIVLGSGTGCSGSVSIFIEALSNDELNHINMLDELLASQSSKQSNQKGFVVATIVQAGSASLLLPGTRIILTDDNTDTIGLLTQSPQVAENRNLPKTYLASVPNLFHDAELVLNSGKSQFGTYDFADSKSSLEIFLELIESPRRLVIFGAGHDAPALAELADRLGIRVSVFDHRKAYAELSRFPQADQVQHYRPEEPTTFPELGSDCYCVAMAHNYLVDKTVLSMLLKSECRYVGALGPKARTERILQDLQREGSNFEEFQLMKLHAPVGLDIGAETPEQIALSIIAEIQAYANNRQAGFLKNRQKPIHSPINESQHDSAESKNNSAEFQKASKIVKKGSACPT